MSKVNDICFKFFNQSCSKEYFTKIDYIFAKIKSSKHKNWNDIKAAKYELYSTIIDALVYEFNSLIKTDKNNKLNNLIRYIVGNYSYYQITKNDSKKEVIIEWKSPDKYIQEIEKYDTDILNSIKFEKASYNTLKVNFNDLFSISFRVHNASFRVENSLKLDIKIVVNKDANVEERWLKIKLPFK